MKMKKVISLAIVATLALGSTYSINPSVFALQPDKAKSLFFFTEDSRLSSQLRTSASDDSFRHIEFYLNENDVKIIQSQDYESVETDEYAFPVSYVQKNSSAQDFLSKQIEQGKKVYLFGDDLTLDTYNNLFGVSFDKPEDIEKLKSTPTDEPQMYIESDGILGVIGYEKDSDIPIYVAEFADQHGRSFVPDQKESLRAIIDHQIVVAENNPSTSVSLLKENTASAALVLRKSQANINKYVYLNGNIMKGQVNSLYRLRQDTDDTDNNYDYFGIEESVEVTKYNAAQIDGVWTIRHDGFGLQDAPYDFQPEDKNSISSFTFELGFPSGVNLGLTWDSNTTVNIDNRSSQSSRYGLWEMDAANITGYFENGVRFKPATSWMSTGSLAIMNSKRVGSFSDMLYDYEFTQTIAVSYDY